MEWLNYHHLLYFHAIAREGGIAKAAQKLRLGQPTLSTQLKQLEDRLGTRLFDRSQRRLKLTESGRVALQYAEEIFRLGAEMVEAVQDRLVPDRVHVQIGALDSVPKPLVRKLVEHAFGLGECTVSVLEGKGDELLRELRAARLDLVLSNFPSPPGEVADVYSRAISRAPVIVCAAPRFAGLRRKFPASLGGQPWIMPTTHSKLRHDVDHFLRVNQIPADVRVETQDTSLQRLLGAAGRGLIPIAEPAAQDLIRDGSLVRLGALAGVFEELWLISASRRIENPIAARAMKGFEL
jgi:LysR family transcriptional activator of nhaA